MSRNARAARPATPAGFGGLAALKATLPPGPVAVAHAPAAVAHAPATTGATTTTAVVAPAAILVPGGPLLPAGWRVEVRVEERQPFWPAWRAETVDVTVSAADGRVIGGPRAAVVAAFKAALAPASRDEAAWTAYIWGLRPRPAGPCPRHLQVPPVLAREAAWRDAASREDRTLLGEAEGLVRWEETQRKLQGEAERSASFDRLGAALSRGLGALAEAVSAFADAYQAGVAAGLSGAEPDTEERVSPAPHRWAEGHRYEVPRLGYAWEAYRSAVILMEKERLQAAYGDERVVVGWHKPREGRLRDYDTRGDWRAAGEATPIHGLRAEVELRSFVERFDAEGRRKTAFQLGRAEGAFERTR